VLLGHTNMTTKSSISLTDDQHSFAKGLVASGQASSLSAVLQQGVELLRRQHADDALEREALRALLSDRSEAQSESAAAFDARLADMIDAKRKAHGLEA